MNPFYLIQVALIIIAGAALVYNGISAYVGIKFLKQKGADSEAKKVKLEINPILRANFAFILKNSRSIVFKDKSGNFWYSPENDKRGGNSVYLQMIFGSLIMIVGIVTLVGLLVANSVIN